MLCVLAGIGNFIVATLDVSQAFLQSEDVSVEDRIYIEPPNYLACPWNGRVLEEPAKDSRASRLLLMKKPLYGLRESPLRWFLQLSRCLRGKGYRQCRIDVCVYTHHANDLLDSVLMCRVGDIVGRFRQDIDKRRFLDAMAEFKTGDAEELTINHPGTLLGLDFRRISPVEIELSQQTFVQRMPEEKLDDIIVKGRRFLSLGNVRSFSKSHLGYMIWIVQTRYDLAFRIVDLATTEMHVLEDVKELARMV